MIKKISLLATVSSIFLNQVYASQDDVISGRSASGVSSEAPERSSLEGNGNSSSESNKSNPQSSQNESYNFDQDPQPINGIAENPEVEAQMSGNYPDMVRAESQPLGAIQRAWDNAEGQAGTYQAVWNPREVIKVRTREYTTTSLILPSWEIAEEIIVGDESAYQVTKVKPHILTVRPREYIGLDSTITVIGGSGRIYSFYIRTEGYNSKNIPDVAVYVKAPKSSINASRLPLGHPQASQDYLEDAYADPSNLKFNFNMAGDSDIAPLRVYSDGIRTWFDYGNTLPKTNLPTIYRVEDDADTPINVTREGQKLVAQATGKFTLRNGAKTVCVWPSSAKGKPA